MNMRKAIFTYDYGPENMYKIRELGFDVLLSLEEGGFTWTPEMCEAEVLVCFNPFAKMNLAGMKQLKWVQLVSKGINHVPEELRGRGILITNNTQATSIPIGEAILSSLLQIFKKSKSFYRKQEKAVWEQDPDILEVYGKTIGFLGTGNIACEAAKRLKAFEATVIGVNDGIGRNNVDYFDQVYRSPCASDLSEFFERCDAVISTLPNTERTYHMINENTIAQMKDGVTLINVSRGSVVDTEALIEALRTGKFRGVALDVFEEEPLPTNSPLWEFNNVIITPHNVFLSDMYYKRCFDTIYGNFQKYVKGEPLRDLADFAIGY